jgi:hypothetical protein
VCVPYTVPTVDLISLPDLKTSAELCMSPFINKL